MKTETKPKKQRILCDGNAAAAYGVMLSRPDVVAFYPITPATPLLERLCQFRAKGLLDTDIVEVEGENTAMSVATSVSAAGGRPFTATAGAGLMFMWDAFRCPPALRMPVVMVIVSREEVPPAPVVSSEQDVWSTKDQGWIHIHNETCQEVLDSVIVAYRLAEDIDILLPTIVSMDGYFLSHVGEIIEIPAQEDVDKFLAPLAQQNRPKLVTDPQTICGGVFMRRDVAQLRYDFWEATERVKTKFVEISREFKSIFGREYGGLIDEYRTEDADIVLAGVGSLTGTAKVAVDRKRDQGMKVGLIKIRVARPFPKEALISALKGKKAVGVIDRNVCLGQKGGHLFVDLKSGLYDLESRIPVANFIDGIGGLDVTVEHLEKAIDITHKASVGKPFEEVTWLGLE